MRKYEVTIGGETYEMAATLGACVTYADEFHGKVDAPYDGLMADDLLTLYNRCEQFKPEKDENGKRVPNDEYVGIEASVIPMLRIVWAAARGARSTKLGWAKFLEMCMDADFNAPEQCVVHDTVVYGLGDGVIFRLPEGPQGGGEADEGHQA